MSGEDTFTKTEHAIANLRRAALACGCTSEDGVYKAPKPKDTYKNIPLKYRVGKKKKVKYHEINVQPTFTCSKCGKQVTICGVATGIPDYWICDECRAKMKKLTVKQTVYEDGFMEVEGTCDFCKQYPCRHVNEGGQFVGAASGKPLVHGLIQCSPYVRKKWLGVEV